MQDLVQTLLTTQQNHLDQMNSKPDRKSQEL